MKQRYWNDLTDNERQRLEQEWHNSEWYARVKRDVKPIQNGSITAYDICSFIGAIWTIIFLFSACSNTGEDVSSITILFIIIGFLIFICGLAAASESKKKSINIQIEKEAEKWLLEKYNIKM